MGQTTDDYYSLALSYDKGSSITYGIVVCQTKHLEHHRLYRKGKQGWRYRNSLYYAIVQSASFASHPLLVPVLLTNIVILLTERKESSSGAVAEKARSTAQADFLENEALEDDINRHLIDRTENLEKKMAKLKNSKDALLDSLHEKRYLTWRSRCHMNLLEGLMRYLAELSWGPRSMTGAVRDETHGGISERLAIQSDNLSDYVNALKSIQQDLLLKAEYVLERKSALVAAVYPTSSLDTE